MISRTTSEPSDGRSRKMVANVAGCRSFFSYISRLSYQHCIHACRTATKFGTHSDGYGTDSNLKKIYPPDPRGVPRGILGGQKFKSPGNVMNCPENQFFFFLNPTPPQGVQMGILGGQKFKSPGNVKDCPENQ